MILQPDAWRPKTYHETYHEPLRRRTDQAMVALDGISVQHGTTSEMTLSWGNMCIARRLVWSGWSLRRFHPSESEERLREDSPTNPWCGRQGSKIRTREIHGRSVGRPTFGKNNSVCGVLLFRGRA
jgi:hypothetical protein